MDGFERPRFQGLGFQAEQDEAKAREQSDMAGSIGLRHLQKLGWKQGEGLGKKKDGLKRALSVGFKADNKGLGSGADEFTFSWWDHVYNKTSSAIVIAKDDEGTIEVRKEKKAKKEASQLYGRFVKSDHHDEEDKKDFSTRISDSALFEACEGRTPRKGARGVKQKGKLKRTSENAPIVVVTKEAAELEADPKKKKKKRQDINKDETEENGSNKVDETSKLKKKRKKPTEDELEDESEETLKSKKKSKKNKKERAEEDPTLPDFELEEVDKIKKKKKKKNKEKTLTNDEAEQQGSDVAIPLKAEKKKMKEKKATMKET
ncbi:G patch domain-containing protein 4 [Phlyctochytrium planicorne]|nr:G patch domain-containing protein 4 [Phlyctochytrium planicorne]